MEILIVSPAASVPNGNSHTAKWWVSELSILGHKVRISAGADDGPADLLIALHAEKSHEALIRFHTNHEEASTVVALTGTDLYPELSSTSLASLEMADRIVVLQGKALARIPDEYRSKARIIHLSASPHPSPGEKEDPQDGFTVCVVGHLRTVKDPMRTARAARLLPPGSSLRVLHAGAILEEKFEEEVEHEEKGNPRYRWLGSLDQDDADRLIASSDLLALTSSQEGGGCVLNEAIAARTPIVASRNDATTSLLGDDYPGLFTFGETGELTTLLHRCESDPSFRSQLLEAAQSHLDACSATRERENWSALLHELFPKPPAGQ